MHLMFSRVFNNSRDLSSLSICTKRTFQTKNNISPFDVESEKFPSSINDDKQQLWPASYINTTTAVQLSAATAANPAEQSCVSW